MRTALEAEFALNIELAGTGGGVPLVMLHGFTGSSRAWGRFGELLAVAGPVLTVDVVGHGESDAPASIEHYRMAAAVDDVVAAVTKAGFPRANWLGYSMGGRLALQIA
ncbi:MAG: alpha/beta fold hydrolase, partial [Tepidiformaceae bacterium]